MRVGGLPPILGAQKMSNTIELETLPTMCYGEARAASVSWLLQCLSPLNTSVRRLSLSNCALPFANGELYS